MSPSSPSISSGDGDLAEPTQIRRRRRVVVLDVDSDDEWMVDISIPSTPADEGLSGMNTSRAGPAGPKVESLGRDTCPPVVMGTAEAPAAEGDSAHGQDGDGDEERDDRQCRICFSGVEEEETFGRLISPCMCTGSMRYVHVKCINAWRGTGTNQKAFIECPQCHHQYQLRRTLASGLATSRPILMFLSTMLFFTITTLTGAALHAFLVNSNSFRRKLLTANTMFDTAATDAQDYETWTSKGDTFIVYGFGGNVMWDVMVSAIQTFTFIAVEFAHWTQDLTDSFVGGLIFDTGIRFILGLAVLGSFSFISMCFTVSFFGPVYMYNTIRGVSFLRNWIRGRNTTRDRSGFGQMMIILFVLIGTAKALWSVYSVVNVITQRVLVYVEAQILEVNPEMRQQEKERRERLAREGWLRRWIRHGRWKVPGGWWELLWRSLHALKEWVKDRWQVAKEGWARGLEEF